MVCNLAIDDPLQQLWQTRQIGDWPIIWRFCFIKTRRLKMWSNDGMFHLFRKRSVENDSLLIEAMNETSVGAHLFKSQVESWSVQHCLEGDDKIAFISSATLTDSNRCNGGALVDAYVSAAADTVEALMSAIFFSIISWHWSAEKNASRLLESRQLTSWHCTTSFERSQQPIQMPTFNTRNLPCFEKAVCLISKHRAKLNVIPTSY